MRILQVCSARVFGGGERHVADLSNALAARGHDVFAALSPASPLFRELRDLPQENLLELPLRNALDIQSARRLARFIREHKVEIVHAHVARDYTLTAYAVTRNPHTKLIITRHVLFPLKRLHRLTLGRASRIIAVSHAVGLALRSQALFPESKLVVIPHGIDLGRFVNERAPDRDADRRRVEGTGARLLVGAIGHLVPVRGHDDFVRAAAQVARKRQDVDFVIAGDDKSRDNRRRAQLEKLIAELGLEKRLRLVGKLDDVAPLLASLDLFVSAARSESFGLAIVEAMASGLPVVATRTEGALEIIEDDVTGSLVPVGDTEALASAIIKLLDDEDARRQLGERARRRARERFSLERMIAATETAYKEGMRDELH
jgi:glycosyltransferase involved in cell wall biosynthesis